MVVAARVVVPPMVCRFPSLLWKGPHKGYEQLGQWIEMESPRWLQWERYPVHLADVIDRQYINFVRLVAATGAPYV